MPEFTVRNVVALLKFVMVLAMASYVLLLALALVLLEFVILLTTALAVNMH
jgi:hypothetical protein